MTLAEATIDTPFRTAEGALRFAYMTESRDIVKISSYLSDLRGGSVKSRKFDGPHDNHAQAAMILQLVQRVLSQQRAAAVSAYYTQPSQPALELRKETDYQLLAELVRYGQPQIPHWYAVDCLREWAKDRRHHDDIWWAKHLNIHPRQLSRYHLGARDRGCVGVVPFVNDLFAKAIDDLTIVMLAGGLIP